MKIKFKHISIEGFLSIGNAEVDLTREGYTLINGINNNPLDHALSNGSGKSSILNAICWTMTGETINGLSTNIPNIHTDTGCKCELLFDVDGSEYKLTRFREHHIGKTDLKISINGEDKSGKGIRESEALLSQYLPDLTSEFLGSVILLGQGLPHKFTDNEPSKRKELLETLSKSEFMIEDIRDRLALRFNELNNTLRELQDKKIELDAEKSFNEKSLSAAKTKLDTLGNRDDLEKEVLRLDELVNTHSGMVENNRKQLAEVTLQLNEINSSLVESKTQEINEQQVIVDNYKQQKEPIETAQATLKLELQSIERELQRVSKLPDICPTCGQKMPADKKPDISQYVVRRDEITKCINEYDVTLTELFNTKSMHIGEIIDKYKNKNDELNTKSKAMAIRQQELTNEGYSINSELSSLKTELSKATAYIDSFDTRKQELEEQIASMSNEIVRLSEDLNKNDVATTTVFQHISSIKKMESVVKRDFRGFLLTNVINFIDLKAKEYSNLVFKTNKLDIKLSGNNINITYCDKAYENLSGGEKQKVDIIIQFAIRDMLCRYLNFSSNILAFDELFDNLDELGTQEILDLIATKLTDVQSIYIISHHGNQLQIPYDYTITIEKNSNGVSSIKY